MQLNLIWLLGIYLLYAAPVTVFIYESWIRKASQYFQQSMMPLSIGLVIFMMWALNAALYVFVFYFALYWLTQYLLVRWGSSYSDSLVISVYLCFAVSVLWEWPIQLTIPQHFDSLAASSFKALGIIFIFQKLVKLGWRPDRTSWWILISIILLGVSLTGNIWLNGINQMFWYTHLYRAPWIIFLLISIRETYINIRLNKQII